MFVGPLKVTCDILSARFSLYQTQGFQAKSKGKALNPFLTLKDRMYIITTNGKAFEQ